MKIINAEWEKRNLGKKTLEIEIEKEDTLNDIVKVVNNNIIDYFVIKLPIFRFDLICPIQDLGFRYIETLNLSKVDTSYLPNLNKINKRFLSQMTYSLMNFEEKESLFEHVEKNLFDSDRISVDTSFSKDLSAKRYQGLIKDELNNGAKLFKINYKKNMVGFFLIKDHQLYSISNLAGIFKEYQKLGFGVLLNYFIIKECFKNKIKILKTAFSSNNYGAFNIHNNLGFATYKRLTIFTKNNNISHE